MTPLFGGWLWLFPATYAVHIAEEGLAGERFYRWIQRIPLARALGVKIGAVSFFVANFALLTVMAGAVAVAPTSGWAWLIPAMAMLVTVNGLGHLAGSLATRSYSPGAVSGLLLWAPLGVFGLWASHRALPPPVFWTGVAAGVLIQAAVGASAALISRLERRWEARVQRGRRREV